MDSPDQLGPQRCMHSAVFCHTVQPRKLGRSYTHIKMRLPPLTKACMASVGLAHVFNDQPRGRKSSLVTRLV